MSTRRGSDNVDSASVGTRPGLPKLHVTPQKLRGELLRKEREIAQLRRLIDTGKASPRLKPPHDRYQPTMRKIEDSIAIIRQHSWSEQDSACIQHISDLLQAGRLSTSSPDMHSKPGSIRRYAIAAVEESSTKHIPNEGDDGSSTILKLKETMEQYKIRLEVTAEREQEVDALVDKLSEACVLSEAMANEYQTKYELLESDMFIERNKVAGMMQQVDVLTEELHLSTNRHEERQREVASLEAANSDLISQLAQEKEFRESYIEQVSELTRENERITKKLADDEEQIRALSCSLSAQPESEHNALLSRISLANTAVSTLQLELRLKQREHTQFGDGDDNGSDADCGSLNCSLTDSHVEQQSSVWIDAKEVQPHQMQYGDMGREAQQSLSIDVPQTTECPKHTCFSSVALPILRCISKMYIPINKLFK